MIAWKDLKAGEQLNKLIALRLGWTAVRKDTLIPLWLSGIPLYKQQTDRQYVPDFSSRPDQCSRYLTVEEGCSLQLEVLSTGLTLARIVINVSSRLNDQNTEWQTGDTLALAWCRAWLAFSDRNSANGQSVASKLT